MTKKTDRDADEIARVRDVAVRRALNTPPKPLKDMKKGRKKQQGDRPTASAEK